MSTPEELLCSRGWRLRHGLWMLWGILSFGMLWSIGFAIVGLRAKNQRWLIFSGIWLAFFIAWVAVSSAIDVPGKGEPSNPISSALDGAIFVSWILGGVLAWLENRKWLVWLAHNSHRGPWYVSATRTPGTSSAWPDSRAVAAEDALRISGSSPVPAAFPGARTSPLLAPHPAVTAAPWAPQRQPWLAPPAPVADATTIPAPAWTPVNVNTATRDQLASLPGIDLAWADHIIATRQSIGGFSDPAELVTAANVQPHVFAGIRDRLVSTPSAMPEPTAPVVGRRLEF
jgi:competence protein ComEA